MQTAESELIVHDDAIRANTAAFCELTHDRVMAVVKADAFGHGSIATSVIEAGASWLGVTSIDEALALRASGIEVPILSWLNTPLADFAAALHAQIDLAVPDPAILYEIVRAAHDTATTARIHLHVDLGLARDGCPLVDWPGLCSRARALEASGIIRVVGVMGHLSSADQPENPQNHVERQAFDTAVTVARRFGLSPLHTHLASTAAILTGNATGYGLNRIGAGLFGIDPSHTTSILRPALTLASTVVSARSVAAGAGIGYGHDFIAPRATNLALVPLGYADGLPRSGVSRAEVLIRGRRRKIVGRCSMDMIVIDTGDERVTPGERLTLFGPGDKGEPTVHEWAAWCSTIEHELVTRIGSRVPRIHRTTTALAGALL